MVKAGKKKSQLSINSSCLPPKQAGNTFIHSFSNVCSHHIASTLHVTSPSSSFFFALKTTPSRCREESLVSLETIPKQDIESPTAPGPLAIIKSRCFTQVLSSTYCVKSQGELGGGQESSPGHGHFGGQPEPPLASRHFSSFLMPCLPSCSPPPPIFNVKEIGRSLLLFL